MYIKVTGGRDRNSNRKKNGLKVRRKMTAEERLREATKLEGQGNNFLSNNDMLDSEEDLGKF